MLFMSFFVMIKVMGMERRKEREAIATTVRENRRKGREGDGDGLWGKKDGETDKFLLSIYMYESIYV